jgi:hypothetical protein
MGTRHYTSVWLRHDAEQSHLFFCPQCQCGLFQYHGSIVQLVPGQLEMTFPITIKCKNRDCDAVYVIEGFVQPVYEYGKIEITQHISHP